MDLVPVKKRSLTPAQFEHLAAVPPEEEWLANITNAKTRGLTGTTCGNSSRMPVYAIMRATIDRPVAYHPLA